MGKVSPESRLENTRQLVTAFHNARQHLGELENIDSAHVYLTSIFFVLHVLEIFSAGLMIVYPVGRTTDRF